MSTNRAEARSREYESYRIIARGTSTEDLKNALEYHRINRSTLTDFLLSISLASEPQHIIAFEEVLQQRSRSGTYSK